MKCKEAESKVQDYIDNKLSAKELEEFIDHVDSCSSCYDELETYYTIRVAMKYLDLGQVHSYNIKEMLAEDMHEKRLYIKHVKYRCAGFGTLTAFAMTALFTLLFLRLNPTQMEKIIEITTSFLGI